MSWSHLINSQLWNKYCINSHLQTPTNIKLGSMTVIVYDVLTHTAHFNRPSCLARRCNFSAHSLWVSQSATMRSTRWTSTQSPRSRFCSGNSNKVYLDKMAISSVLTKREKYCFISVILQLNKNKKGKKKNVKLRTTGRCTLLRLCLWSSVLYHSSFYNPALAITYQISDSSNNKLSSIYNIYCDSSDAARQLPKISDMPKKQLIIQEREFGCCV